MSLGMNMRLDERERIIKNTVILNREKPFFAYILMNFDIHQTQKDSLIPTMAVTKYGRLYWNEEFVKELTNSELQYVLAHETLHIAKGDYFRRGSRDPRIWNIASDCIINDILNVENMTAPRYVADNAEKEIKRGQFKGLIPDKSGTITLGGYKDSPSYSYNVRGKTTEQLYDEIIVDAEEIEQIIITYVGSGGEGSGGVNAPHGGFDIHIDDDSDDKGESTGDQEHGSASSQAAESKWKKLAVEAATIARQRGQMPGYAEGLIDDILNPVVDWRSRLRSFIVNEIPVDFETRLPGRSFYGTGVWCPRIHRENVNIFCSIDCSGSTMPDRPRFIGELQGIITSHPQLKARLIFWSQGDIGQKNDVEITSQTVDQIEDLHIENINGGTELSSYNRYLDKMEYSSRIHIILTDGHIEDEPDVPDGQILFVLCHNGSDEIIKEYGEVIHIRDEQEDWSDG